MSETKANELVAEAEKKMSGFSLFSSGEEKREKAHALLLQAATIFKANANFVSAGMTYKRAADIAKKNNDDISYGDDMSNAMAMMLKCDNYGEASKMGTEIVDYYDKTGKYSIAARICMQLGEYKPESAGLRTSDEVRTGTEQWLLKAMTYYRNEGSRATANDIRLKLAERKALNGDLEGAKAEFEALGTESIDAGLTRGMAHKHFFMALLCLVGSLKPSNLMEQGEILRQEFEKYTEMDTQFSEYTREHMLITGILRAVDETDVEVFEDAVHEFSEIGAVDQLKARLLVQGKQALRQAVDGDAH
jgi:alpha-soluble NSF attachment protein